jgi:hypothetical protein
MFECRQNDDGTFNIQVEELIAEYAQSSDQIGYVFICPVCRDNNASRIGSG